MQEYLHRSRIGGAMDGIGFHVFAYLGSSAWFIWQWGLRLPALTAGAALYGLIVLLRRKIRDDSLVRKEKRLRAAIGGELALERLLLSSPERANFELAMLLSVRCRLILLQITDAGILCSLKGEKILIAFVQLPASAALGAERVLFFQREVKKHHGSRGIMCAPCTVSPEAREQAEGQPGVSFISRETMISLFGSANPATDGQLVTLGQRRKKAPAARWLHSVLDIRRARRYACYGGLLLGMYQFTHLPYYAIPGLVCVFLAAACRCQKRDPDDLSALFDGGA